MPYLSKTNAINITLYHPEGRTVAEEVRKEFAALSTKIAKREGLLVNVTEE